MKNHKKLIIIVIATVLCTALLGSYLNSVDEGLSTSVTRSMKNYNRSYFKKMQFLPEPFTSGVSVDQRFEQNLNKMRTLDIDTGLKNKVNPKLEEIDSIIDDIEDIVNIGTPDGNIYGIGTPDGNIVGIGTPDGN